MSEETATKKRAFVVWDSQTKGGVSTTLQTLVRLPPPGYDVNVPCLGSKPGPIWSSVSKDIREADIVLGIVDLPNANVGFEIGYALGLAGLAKSGAADAGPAKRVRIASATPKMPSWVGGYPPFKGQYLESGARIGELREILVSDASIPAPAPSVKGNSTVLLCPREFSGEAVHEIITAAALTWSTPETHGWQVDDLPKKVLHGAGRVVWIILDRADQPARDGDENAIAGVVAGYAKANGIDLHVWRHKDARDVVDVGVEERVWSNIDELDGFILELGTAADPAAPRDALALYRRYLRSAHRNLVPFFDHVPGALGDVYVELALDFPGTTDVEGMGDVGEQGDEGSAESVASGRRFAHEVPKFLSARPSLRDLLEQPIDEALTGRYVVVGMPGAGKSTVCRRLCFDLAGDTTEDAAGVVPVFFSLARFARAGGRSPFDLAEEDLAKANGAETAKGFADRLVQLAGEGRVWLLADGLDEVPQDDLARVREYLEAWATDEALSNARLVVTTRDVAYDALPAPFVRTNLRPLQDEDAQKLLRKWLGDDAVRVWQRIGQAPRLREIADNPLMLTLIAMLAKDDDQALPPTRTRLYERAVDLLLVRGHGSEKKGVLDPKLALRVLVPLSLRLHESAQESWTDTEVNDALFELGRKDPAIRDAVMYWGAPSPFLDDLARNSGLLGPYGGNNEPWRYMHRSLREYLAACALRDDKPDQRLRHMPSDEKAPRSREALEARARKIRHWAETYALLVGLLKTQGELMEMLGRLRLASADLMLRVLPQIDGVDAGTAFHALIRTDGWDGDHLLALVRGWLVDGVSPEDLRRVVYTDLARARVEEAAHRFYALRMATIPFDEDEFFGAANLPPRAELPAIDTVRLPPNDEEVGTFWMGSLDGEGKDNERPRHQVTLSTFRIGTAPITEREYAQFDRKPSDKDPEQPITEVSWWEAWLFAQWLGGDLPTEAQWEYACRAGTETPWWTGDTEESLEKAAWFGEDYGKDSVHPVRAKEANPWGLYDVHGNVWEWCGDWFGAYVKDSVRDPTGPASGSHRVMRGGGFRYAPFGLRSAYRFWDRPGFRGSFLGFRVVLPPSELR